MYCDCHQPSCLSCRYHDKLAAYDEACEVYADIFALVNEGILTERERLAALENLKEATAEYREAEKDLTGKAHLI